MLKNIFRNSPTHMQQRKIESRQKILKSAFQLFTQKGFDSVTLDDVMGHCGLTRGGFYAHFPDKATLYSESIRLAFADSKLAQSVNAESPKETRLIEILQGYLSIEHVRGESPCPFAFLASDIALRDDNTREMFSNALMLVNARVWSYASACNDISEEDMVAVTSMVIGTVALARTMKDEITAKALLQSTKRQVEKTLNLNLTDEE